MQLYIGLTFAVVLLIIIYIYFRKPSRKEGLTGSGCTLPTDFSANVVPGVASGSTGMGVIAVGTNAILYSEDGGKAWSSGTVSALNLKDVAMSGANAVAVATNALMYSKDGGKSWNTGTVSALNLKDVAMAGMNAIAVGTNAIMYSTNAGKSWGTGTASALNLTAVAMDKASPSKGVAVANNAILYTSNGGKSWASGTASAMNLRGVAMSNNKVVAIGTNMILRSDDGGKTWSTGTVSAMNLTSVAMSEKNVVVVGTNSILYSGDAGKTWGTGTVSALNLTDVAISGSNVVAVGTNSILYSTNAGKSWNTGTVSALNLTGVAFGGVATQPCIANGSMNLGMSCNVKASCLGGNKPTSTVPALFQYTCGENGTLIPPVAVTCPAPKCNIPDLSTQNLAPGKSTGSGAPQPCQSGASLSKGDTCSVVCKAGYSGDGTNGLYTCGADGVAKLTGLTCGASSCPMPDWKRGFVPGDNSPCATGQQLTSGESCSVKCQSGWSPVATNFKYSCVDGAMTPPTNVCTPPTGCTVNMGPSLIAGAANGCKDAQVLSPSTSCTVACAPGYKKKAGSSTYTCSATGSFISELLQCAKPPGCLTPNTYGNGVMGSSGPTGCVKGKTLNTGDKCSVQCMPGYTSDGGTTQYGCNNGVPIIAGLSCSKKGCPLPTTFGSGMMGGGQTPCMEGGSLAPDTSCDLECENGYTSNNLLSEYTCTGGKLNPISLACTAEGCTIPSQTAFAKLNMTPGGINPCVAGYKLPSNKSCDVQCKTGYKRVGGTDSFSCTNGGLTPATLQCEPISCPLPASFGEGMEGTSPNGCTAGGYLSANETCAMQCKPGFNTVVGTSDYNCNTVGTLTPPSLSCNPIICKLPASLGKNMEPGDNAPCAPWGRLLAGDKCSVKCSEGYVEDGGLGAYKCSTTGVLSSGKLQCVAEAHKKSTTITEKEDIRQKIKFQCAPSIERDNTTIEIDKSAPYLPAFGKSGNMKPASALYNSRWGSSRRR